MASKQSLYGAPRPNSGFQGAKKEIPSSTSLAFSSQLSSLLAQSASTTTTSQPTPARARPSKAKDDIFKTHNKNSKKRALADISRNDDGALDAADRHRSKRKMEEKARLYAAMKRGDYVPPSNGSSRSSNHNHNSNSNNAEEHSLVDFDRKWAEEVSAGRHHAEPEDTSSSSDNDGSETESLVDYEDEFGRQRRVTRSERTRETRRRAAVTYAESQLQSFAARPTAPSSVIRGDTIQAAAFNPDRTVSEQMAELARKRDKSLTPPPETHYDASKEIRAKGVGFYAFSQDEAGRKREMEELERRRGETERVRREQEERRERREREVEERRRAVKKMREEKLADRFLRGLG
ncbi:MAG: hypothetical protein LQ344_006983 [Seirophora lacunosa]|nr:MAG: hypothetical protein LQ344_006983 [Seirophora lacunosa]